MEREFDETNNSDNDWGIFDITDVQNSEVLATVDVTAIHSSLFSYSTAELNTGVFVRCSTREAQYLDDA